MLTLVTLSYSGVLDEGRLSLSDIRDYRAQAPIVQQINYADMMTKNGIQPPEESVYVNVKIGDGVVYVSFGGIIRQGIGCLWYFLYRLSSFCGTIILEITNRCNGMGVKKYMEDEYPWTVYYVIHDPKTGDILRSTCIEDGSDIFRRTRNFYCAMDTDKALHHLVVYFLTREIHDVPPEQRPNKYICARIYKIDPEADVATVQNRKISTRAKNR
ncbi:hypothetical protein EX30DRAFT_189288 [Ascodesmis nigricans]|uniref:Uncharacterized protein n=1 Tax=Ascodesmis nigricans TaxID=341454 RepID=A0A4S2N0P3_9PEZI|nr:hypothetical protein EX30DRAFT_189288 [Ascodesmis nigricans]